MSRIEIRGVSKSFGPNVLALKGIDLVVEQGERVAVLGPSGSGKSTLLRMIAGLERPDAGSLWMDGGTWPRCRHIVARWLWCFKTPRLIPT